MQGELTATEAMHYLMNYFAIKDGKGWVINLKNVHYFLSGRTITHSRSSIYDNLSEYFSIQN